VGSGGKKIGILRRKNEVVVGKGEWISAGEVIATA
jgi:hypothetical protein